MMQDNMSTIHGLCTHITRCRLFLCCATHPCSWLWPVYTSSVSLLPHGDVVASLCRRRRLPSPPFATAGDPSCVHQPMVCVSSSSSSLVLRACCTLCAPSVTSSASSTAFYRTAIHRITRTCRRVPVAHSRPPTAPQIAALLPSATV